MPFLAFRWTRFSARYASANSSDAGLSHVSCTVSSASQVRSRSVAFKVDYTMEDRVKISHKLPFYGVKQLLVGCGLDSGCSLGCSKGGPDQTAFIGWNA